MKIWWVNHFAVPPDQPGGTRHYTLARELIRRGHDVTLYASSVDYVSRGDTRLGPHESVRREMVCDVPFVWVKTPEYGAGSLGRVRNMCTFAWQTWRRAFEATPERPDLVVGSTPHPFAALAAERLAARYGVPFTLEVRDVWPQSLVDLGDHSRLHPFILLLGWLERYLCRRADLLLSLLPGAAPHLVSKGARPDSIVMLPNGIDLDLIPAPAPEQDDGVFRLIYAGAHGLANGLETVLDAAVLMQREQCPVKFVLIGDGPLKQQLVARAQRENIANVEFLPAVAKSEIHGVLAQANAFVLPLKSGSVFQHGVSPNKLFDYMAAGRPVIFAVDAPNNPVRDALAGLTVPPESPEALAAAVDRLRAMDRAERVAMGQRARAYVECHHDLRRLAGRLEGELCKVCDCEAEPVDQALL